MINYLFLLNMLGVFSQHNSNTYSFTNTPTLVNTPVISYTPLPTKIVTSTYTNPTYPEYKIQPYTSSYYEKILFKNINFSDIIIEDIFKNTKKNTKNNTKKNIKNNTKNMNIIEKNTTDNTIITFNLNQIVFLIHVLNISYIVMILIHKFKNL